MSSTSLMDFFREGGNIQNHFKSEFLKHKILGHQLVATAGSQKKFCEKKLQQGPMNIVENGRPSNGA